jgi:predicted nucleic acid-binding protein
MIILDTNVVSEMMRSSPSPEVANWLLAQPPPDTYVTAVTRAEIFYGIELLPASKRRSAIAEAGETLFGQRLATPILPFDSDAALVFAKIAAGRRRLARPMDFMDAQIAAIARARRATIATRDAPDFAHCGVRVVNPWRA